MTTVCGGITNKLFRCEISPEKDDNSQTSRVFLVRVFGAEGLIDRELETMQFLALYLAGLGPPYHGRFANGRVEGFYEDCRTLTPADLSKPDLSRKIAIQMAKCAAPHAPPHPRRRSARIPPTPNPGPQPESMPAAGCGLDPTPGQPSPAHGEADSLGPGLRRIRRPANARPAGKSPAGR